MRPVLLALALALGLAACGSSAATTAAVTGPGTNPVTAQAAADTSRTPLATATEFVRQVVTGADPSSLATGEDVVVALRGLLPFRADQPLATVVTDAERNEVESGSAQECGVSDVTAICFVVVDDVPDADPLHLQVFVTPDYPDGTTVMDGVVVGADGVTLAGSDFPLLVDHVELVTS